MTPELMDWMLPTALMLKDHLAVAPVALLGHRLAVRLAGEARRLDGALARSAPQRVGGWLTRAGAPRHGDILIVERSWYTHFALFALDGPHPTVIHYTSEGSDISGRNEVMETDLAHFRRGDSPFHILDLLAEGFTPFDPDEAVARARKRLGERRYGLATNNCEHLVLWCATGHACSRQVAKFTASLPLVRRWAESRAEAEALLHPQG